MQKNFSCSTCLQEAVYCCCCLSVRTYLCEVCMPLHIAKTGGEHPISPASLPSYVDQTGLQDYSRRAACFSKLRESVDVVSACLAEEHRHLDDVYTLLVERLNTAYMEINENYIGLENDLRTLKQDVLGAEKGLEVSPKTRWYLERGFHLPSNFVDAQRTMSRRVAGDESKEEPWSSEHCNCTDCKEVRAVMFQEVGNGFTAGYACSGNAVNAKVYATSGAERFWICSMCQFDENAIGNEFCQRCHNLYYPNQDLVCASSIPSTNTGDMWTCTRCGYCNSSLKPNCERCGGVSLPPEVAPCQLCGQFCGGACQMRTHRSEADLRMPFESSRGWQCRYCRETSNALADTFCYKCGLSSGLTPWKCFGCSKTGKPDQSHCKSCKSSKDLSAYLDRRGAPLSRDKTSWKCRMCGELIWVRMAVCHKCGYVEELVKRALEFRGNDVSLGERLSKMFSG